MALTYSTMPPLGAPAHGFRLPDVDGKIRSLADFAEAKILVVVFMCNHCPYVLAVLDRLIALQNDYRGRGVRLIGINSNDVERYPDDSPANMKKMSVERKIPFPYLFDATQETAKTYGAVCTPDLFVYGPARTLLYRGRIDDNWKEPDKITRQDLRQALDLILQDRAVFADQTPSMGCSIKWKPS